jgi:hypothetical protein
MTTSEAVDQIVNAVLYEGYLLYPYRQSAVKNRVRWTFGGIHPRAYSVENGGSDAWQMQTQCLLRIEPGSRRSQAGCQLSVEVRFLQLMERRSAGSPPWQEASERRVSAPALDPFALETSPFTLPISFGPSIEEADRVSRETQAIEGSVRISTEKVTDEVVRLSVVIANHTPVPGGLGREAALMHSLVSANILLRVAGGSFVSQADPPSDLQEASAACRNLGTWPVLMGEPGAADTMLSSPILLEDYPRVAAESPGDLFDSTEIDEILSLRILTMTEEEKEEVRAGDERGRKVLERTESLTAEDLMQMHGTIRSRLRHVDSSDE